MAKLAGILSLDGAPADPTLAARLLAPSDRAEMRRDARTWSGDSVTLGCVDAQPLVHEASACVAVLDGRIDNRVELRARLSDLAHDAPDAVYVLKAYEEWGTQFASRLLGDFACAIWDGRRGRLLLARDPIGARPLYHAAHRERFLFASTVEQLFRDPALPREIDDDAAVRALYMRPSGEAAF